MSQAITLQSLSISLMSVVTIELNKIDGLITYGLRLSHFNSEHLSIG